MQERTPMQTPDWAGSSGDIWARRWRDTDRALAAVGEALDRAILEAAPEGAFSALDVGCGPGTTSLSLAARRPDASILGCDLSEPLVGIARERSAGSPNVRFNAADAEQAALEHRPFDLIFSRHGVMFFDDPHRAFRALREAAAGEGRLVFSCFRSWAENPWAGEIASAAAGTALPPPGREPSGFAFADPAYVRDILDGAGWADAQPQAVNFSYVAGEGLKAVDQALDFLAELGPASRVLEGIADGDRDAAMLRMRQAISAHHRDGRVIFPAAAWLWRASAE